MIKTVCLDTDCVEVQQQKQFASYLEKEHSNSTEMTQSLYKSVFNDCLIDPADLNRIPPPFLQN